MENFEKVAIVGTAPTSRLLAPFNDPSWHIWACSPGNQGALPRVTIWFELHALAELMAAENRAGFEPHLKWLREQTEAGAFQVVMQELNSFVPKAIPFPRDQMLASFGRYWFTSSIAWMMALAISKGAKEIALFGVDMAHTEELYSGQRAGCLRFIEIAEAKGIKVQVPRESCLLAPTPLYGYWEQSHMGRRLNAVGVEINAQIAQMNAQIDALRMRASYFNGAKEQLDYIRRTWTNGGDDAILNMGPFGETAAAETAGAAKAAPADPAPAPEVNLVRDAATGPRMPEDGGFGVLSLPVAGKALNGSHGLQGG